MKFLFFLNLVNGLEGNPQIIIIIIVITIYTYIYIYMYFKSGDHMLIVEVDKGSKVI